jgi:hypothetical protein
MTTLVKRRMTTTVIKNSQTEKVPQVPTDVFRKRTLKEGISAFKKFAAAKKNRDAELKLLYSPGTTTTSSLKNESTRCSAESNIVDMETTIS